MRYDHTVKSTPETRSLVIADCACYVTRQNEDGTVSVIVKDLDGMPAGPFRIAEKDIEPICEQADESITDEIMSVFSGGLVSS